MTPTRWIGIALIGVLMLAACNGTPTAETPVSSPTSISPSATPLPLTPSSPTPSPTTTSTPSPTLTPTPSIPVPLLQYSPWDLVNALAWSPDGVLLAVAAGNNLHIYDGASLEELRTLNVGSWASSLAFRPLAGDTSAYLLALVTKDSNVQLWDAGSGSLICQWHAHNRGGNSVAFSPDGKVLASSGNDGIVRLWDVEKMAAGECDLPALAEMIGGTFAVPAIAFNPDGSLIAAVDVDKVYLRNPSTQLLVNTLWGETSIFSLAFSPDGKLLAGGEAGNTLRIWDLQSGETWQVLAAGGDANDFLWSVAFSPDGNLLAGGSSDGNITLWEVESGTLGSKASVGRTLSGHTRAVTSVAFSPDGETLVSGGLDAAVWFWKLK